MLQQNVFELIPKNKFDFSTINQLMRISEDDVQPILSKLLDWIADFNWPIAEDVCKVLARFPNSITPLLKEALNPNAEDEILKYWIILKLIPLLPRNTQMLLKEDLCRIYEHPTTSEKIQEVDEQAETILKQYYT